MSLILVSSKNVCSLWGFGIIFFINNQIKFLIKKNGKFSDYINCQGIFDDVLQTQCHLTSLKLLLVIKSLSFYTVGKSNLPVSVHGMQRQLRWRSFLFPEGILCAYQQLITRAAFYKAACETLIKIHSANNLLRSRGGVRATQKCDPCIYTRQMWCRVSECERERK